MVEGNLLGCVVNHLVAWYKGLRVVWSTSFSNKFSLFKLEKRIQKMFAIHGFHSENIFWKKSYIKKCNFVKC